MTHYPFTLVHHIRFISHHGCWYFR